MRTELASALALVRDGRVAEVQAAQSHLEPIERTRLELALALRGNDSARAVELAALLWYRVEVDATVLATLVRYEHPELRDLAVDALFQNTVDATCDVSTAWQSLAAAPGDLDAWRDVLSSLVAQGRELEAIDGVARALAEGHVDFGLWALLTTTLLTYRRGAALRHAIRLGRRAFEDAPEALATNALIYVGLGELAAAGDELDAIGQRQAAHPLVIAARAAVAEATGGGR